MGKLTKRYSDQEFATLSECIRPYELWTAAERRMWAVVDDCYGFRQFSAKNITPIELYWPKPSPAIHTPKQTSGVM